MTKLKSHDKLGMRLGIILTELFSGKTVELETLSLEFNVSVRTIQRDLNERLMYLPISNIRGTYKLDPEYLTRIVRTNS
jgi:predicted DNA-binding transcriptional regulator YafY